MGGGLSASSSSSAAASQSGNSSSGGNYVGSSGFPFGAPASQNFMLYGLIGLGMYLLIKRK